MEKRGGGHGKSKIDDSTIGGYNIENLPTQRHDKIGIMVTGGTFRAPIPDIRYLFLFLFHSIS